MLQPGDLAPAFTAQVTDGSSISLNHFHGKQVVLYFYPKDDTPGCTREACAFRDYSEDFAAAGAVVLGVSRDSVASHQKFAAKYGLTFPLLADADGQLSEAYGVWQEKKNYGRTYWGIVRTTFLIDEQGRIGRVWNNVKVDGHADAVLAAIRGEDKAPAKAKTAKAGAKAARKPAAAKTAARAAASPRPRTAKGR